MLLDSKYYFLIPFVFLGIFCSAQIPQEEKNLIRISKEVWLGATLHSNGIGVNFDVAKFKTHKSKSLFNVELLTMRHDKEYKIFGAPDENAKKFVFGKLNSLFVGRLGTGRRKIIVEKLRENGLQFAINWNAGISIGFVKPVYLEVFKYDLSDKLVGISLERYDPEEHNFFDIYGRGPWSAGLIETKINPGGYFKAGIEFDYSNTREIINTLELGISLDVFSSPVEIMLDNNSNRLFPTIYLNCAIGNKFY